MNNTRELKDMRELKVDELDVVSGGSFLSFVSEVCDVLTLGVGGTAVVQSTARVVKRA